MAITAFFVPTSGQLSVLGDALDNATTISRNAAGQILVNGGTVVVAGGTPTVANTARINIFGQAGSDNLVVDESNGALPAVQIFAGVGDDTLIGGSGADYLFGQAGNDRLEGKGGNDFLFGGSENDTLIGGDGDDQMFGEAGDDLFIWNPGDDTDLMEGGTGVDTVEVNGGGGAEQFTITANGTRVRFDRLDPAPFALDIGTMENIVVNMNGGDDSFSATGNLAALIKITVDGGAGNDTILGSNGADVLIGGEGNDFIDGQQGNDVVLLGTGDDTFQWDPGDGSDVVEGQDGIDTMLFNGSNANEIFNIAPDGERVRFTRNVGNVVMDLNEVERIELKTLGGADTVLITNLSSTDLTEVKVDLAATNGIGDGQADSVIVNATGGNDIIDVFGAGTSVAVVGLSALVNVTGAEGSNDTLVINGLDGDDGITATTLPAGVIKLTLDGGAGNDTILGSQGADVIFGGSGNDFVFGDNGNDLALLGEGDDVFQWDPGDGNDTLEGQDGTDTLRFFGSNASENINILANGGRALFLRDVASVTMDLDDMEVIDFRALGGADNIVIGDMSGTDVTQIGIDLRGPDGGGDGAADTITVSATNGADVFGVTGDAGGITVFGLQAQVNVFFAEVANDRLTLNGLGGDDVIDASGLEAGGIQLTMNGGLGADVLIGSEGGDLVLGGDGNDLALLGAGDDTFVWNPGDDNDVVEGQAGFDTLDFNGANVAETINISANGGRAIFTRNVANVVMDLNDVESIDFDALGGADTIVMNDLTGTDVTQVNVNLAASNGGGDAQPDTVIANATDADDVIIVVGDAGGISVFGLAAQLNITGAEVANDRLVINGGDGDDVIEASGVAVGAIGLTLNGGDGNDVLIGSDGNDILIGGPGNDVLIGGLGIDILDPGEGDDIVIQGFTVGEDLIDLRGKDIGDYAALLALAKEIGSDIVVDFDDGTRMTIADHSLASLQADSFLI